MQHQSGLGSDMTNLLMTIYVMSKQDNPLCHLQLTVDYHSCIFVFDTLSHQFTMV